MQVFLCLVGWTIYTMNKNVAAIYIYICTHTHIYIITLLKWLLSVQLCEFAIFFNLCLSIEFFLILVHRNF